MAFIQSRSVDSGSVSSATLAYNSNIIAGSLLIQAARVGSGTATIAMTSPGNIHTQDKSQLFSTDTAALTIHSAPNAAAGATTVTATLTGGPATLRWAIHEYGSMATSAPVDVSASAQSTGGSPADSGSITTTVADDLLFVAGAADDVWSSVTAGSGYTLREAIPVAPNIKIATEGQDLVAIGSYNGTFTFGGPPVWACAIVAYKPAAAAAGHPAMRRFGGVQHAARIGKGIY